MHLTCVYQYTDYAVKALLFHCEGEPSQWKVESARRLVNRPFIHSFARAWIERHVYTSLYAGFDRVALQLLSLLCAFEILKNVAKYRSILILFQNKLKGLL